VHLDEEEIQRLLHGELGQQRAASAREHAAACGACRARVAEAEEDEAWVFDRLTHLDHPPPPVAVASTMVGRRDLAWGRWAAGIVLVGALAGVAYAAPGSPLRGIVRRVAEVIAGKRPDVVQEVPPQRAENLSQGIAVDPGNRFTIVFAAEQRGGGAMLSLTDTTDVVVRAVGGAATFTSDVDRLSVDNRRSSARFVLEIPRRAPHVEIWVGGHRVFSKNGSQIASRGRRESADRFFIPFFRAAQ
jgi:hypothetical protein